MKREKPLEIRVAELRAGLAQLDPALLAKRAATSFVPKGQGVGKFHLTFWGRAVEISFPEFQGSYVGTKKPLDTFSLAQLVYYFHDSDGTPQAGSWIAFTELPDGRFYTRAFQGYSGDELLRHFGDNLELFEQAARQLGGTPVGLGERAFAFQALPRVALLAACWLGDEDFPTSYKILFDAAISHHLSTEGCAILGSSLTRQLIKAAQQPG